MILKINGDVQEYYVQMLCMLFFPGTRFSEKHATENEPVAEISVTADETGITAAVTVRVNEKTKTATYTEPKKEGRPIEKTTKMAVGKAFFEAAGKMVGKTPQWGILTGVRPSKIALAALNDGMTKAEVKSMLTGEFLVNAKKASLVCDTAYNERKIIADASRNGCSLYISIPFCPSRCSYCSFVSYTSPKLFGLLEGYLEQLCRDVEEEIKLIYELGLRIMTVYIGGGTPTTLSAEQLEKLLSVVTSGVRMEEVEEFTVEAGRPDTITREKLEVIKKYGVNRVCINTQTLNDEVLELVGRKHTVKQFYEAFALAREVGIEQINTDLIAGLPGEGFGSFSATIDEMIRLRPENLTFHTLCIKNAADFSAMRSDIIGAGSVSATKLIDYAHLSAKNAGYIPYYMYRQKNTVDNLENVGFCLPGCEGRYNIYMMEEIHSIFAVGAGAVTKLVSRDCERIERVFEFKYPFEYLSEKNEPRKEEKKEKIRQFYQNIW